MNQDITNAQMSGIEYSKPKPWHDKFNWGIVGFMVGVSVGFILASIAWL